MPSSPLRQRIRPQFWREASYLRLPRVEWYRSWSAPFNWPEDPAPTWEQATFRQRIFGLILPGLHFRLWVTTRDRRA